jgi:hypothetical protein
MLCDSVFTFENLRRAGASSPRFGPRMARLPWSATRAVPKALGYHLLGYKCPTGWGGAYGAFWDIWDIACQKIAGFGHRVYVPSDCLSCQNMLIAPDFVAFCSLLYFKKMPRLPQS